LPLRLPNSRSCGRRRGPRSKAEIERERKERWERTCKEVDEVHKAYAAKFTTVTAEATGIAYARYSTKHQDSIADQIRTILDHALDEKIWVPRQQIFFDLAIRGFKKNRQGIEDAEGGLRAKRAKVLLLFATSRLFRKQYRTLEFVDRIHRGLGVRCIFVKSGVDTNEKQRWESILAFNSMVDQFVVTMYVANIHSAHEGLLRKCLAFGTLSYGYMGDPIAGEFTKLGKPRCRIVIDPEAAKVVRQIFKWYVVDGYSIAKIIGLLNADLTIPLPPRTTSGEFTRLAVRRILTNLRYVEIWQYGVTESVYLPDGDYTRQRTRVEPLLEIRLPDLRIIDDETWHAAQIRLAKEGRNGGRRSKDGDRRSRPSALRGLLICSVHECVFYVSGAYGSRLRCPRCHRQSRDARPLFSTLNRSRAVELVCNTLGALIREDPKLVDTSLAACRQEVEAAQRPDPSRLHWLRQQVERLSRSIEFTRRNPGETQEDQAEAAISIKQLQSERSQYQSEVKVLEAQMGRVPKMPTEEEARGLIESLENVLSEAASGSDNVDSHTVRQIIELLTGGGIMMYQMGTRDSGDAWLQGRFKVKLLPYLVGKLTGTPATSGSGVEIVIDFKSARKTTAEMDRAWEFYDTGMLCVEIARELGCSRSKVTKLLQQAAQLRGVPLVDGRSRRSTLEKKHFDPALYQRLADGVMRMVGDRTPLGQIAQELGVDRNTVTSAIRWWHESRGLPVPDGRSLRRFHRRNGEGH
jgi:DNA invertase Pin-like site-specific DNA recombinase/DNA-binding CsgD family transcriptional regulator